MTSPARTLQARLRGQKVMLVWSERCSELGNIFEKPRQEVLLGQQTIRARDVVQQVLVAHRGQRHAEEGALTRRRERAVVESRLVVSFELRAEVRIRDYAVGAVVLAIDCGVHVGVQARQVDAGEEGGREARDLHAKVRLEVR